MVFVTTRLLSMFVKFIYVINLVLHDIELINTSY